MYCSVIVEKWLRTYVCMYVRIAYVRNSGHNLCASKVAKTRCMVAYLGIGNYGTAYVQAYNTQQFKRKHF